MEVKRPDPDELLDRALTEEKRQRQGQLKIFFGAAPGVGKTYAMIAAARQRREEGLDIAVGIVETHGRRETARRSLSAHGRRRRPAPQSDHLRRRRTGGALFRNQGHRHDSDHPALSGKERP